MEKRVFLQWLNEKRLSNHHSDVNKRVLQVDNVNTHDRTEEVRAGLQEINTEIWFFLYHASHLVQPLDRFVIHKLKTYWRIKWD